MTKQSKAAKNTASPTEARKPWTEHAAITEAARIAGATAHTNTSDRNKPMKTLKIDKSYTQRDDVPHFDDTPNQHAKWQEPVYALADRIIAHHYSPTCPVSVGDIGCGSAWKLVNMLHNAQTTGYEVEPTLSWLKRRYPTRTWLPSQHLDQIEHNVIICSDVIEHIKDPIAFMEELSAATFDHLVISTPDREYIGAAGTAQRKQSVTGPPINPHHYREWTTNEFVAFLSQWLNITHTSITGQNTITIVAQPKQTSV